MVATSSLCASVLLKKFLMFRQSIPEMYCIGSLLKYIFFGVNEDSSLVMIFRIPFCTAISCGLPGAKKISCSMNVSASIFNMTVLTRCVVYVWPSMSLQYSLIYVLPCGIYIPSW